MNPILASVPSCHLSSTPLSLLSSEDGAVSPPRVRIGSSTVITVALTIVFEPFTKRFPSIVMLPPTVASAVTTKSLFAFSLPVPSASMTISASEVDSILCPFVSRSPPSCGEVSSTTSSAPSAFVSSACNDALIVWLSGMVDPVNVPRLVSPSEAPDKVIRSSTAREAAVGIVGVPDKAPYAPEVATACNEAVVARNSTAVSNSCIPALTVPLSEMVEPVNVCMCCQPTPVPTAVLRSLMLSVFPSIAEVSSAASAFSSSSCRAVLTVELSVIVEPVNVPKWSDAVATPDSVTRWSTSRSACVVSAGLLDKSL